MVRKRRMLGGVLAAVALAASGVRAQPPSSPRPLVVELSPLVRGRLAEPSGPTVGGRVGVVFGLERLEVTLGLAVDGGRTASGDLAVRAQAGAVRAGLCLPLAGPRGRAAFVPCVGAAAGLQRVRLSGVGETSSTVWATFAPRLGLWLRLPLSARVALRAGGAVERPILRRRLSVVDAGGGSQLAWGMAPVAFEAALALELGFPRRE